MGNHSKAVSGRARAREVTPGLTNSVTWVDLPKIQQQHDAMFHDDVMTSSAQYQMRHSLMHVEKILGAFASIVEKSFHGEELDAERHRFVNDRVPDLLVFALKLAHLVKADWRPLPEHGGPCLGTGYEGEHRDWMERQLGRLESSVFAMTAHRSKLMEGPIDESVRAVVSGSIPGIVEVASSMASFYGQNPLNLYVKRLLEVERKKIK